MTRITVPPITPIGLRISAECRAERRRRFVRAVVDIAAVIVVSLLVTLALVMQVAGEG